MEKASKFAYFMNSFLTLIFCAFITYEVPQIINLFSIIGGYIFTCLAILIPGIFL